MSSFAIVLCEYWIKNTALFAQSASFLSPAFRHGPLCCHLHGRLVFSIMIESVIIRALEQLKEPCDITFCSDSKYVMDGLSKGWAKGWRARGWVKSDKKPALNSDLWAHLLDLCEGHTFHYNWVKGHAGHPENERCDELAVQAAAQYK